MDRTLRNVVFLIISVLLSFSLQHNIYVEVMTLPGWYQGVSFIRCKKHFLYGSVVLLLEGNIPLNFSVRQ